MSTPREVIARATRVLDAAGVTTPRVDAELLLAHVLEVPRRRLLASGTLTPDQDGRFAAGVARRAGHEPLQHITGSAPFRWAELAVGPGVFVPRPETELLVDAVLPHLSGIDDPVVVDLCSGSGALAVAVAQEVAGARVLAVERSADALPWLTRNAATTNAATNAVTVVVGDVADPDLLRAERGRVDAVLANPPYVPDRSAVAPEVHADPAEAVFAGPDGLAVIPAVIARAADLLRPGGILALEHDETHEDAVPRLLAATDDWAGVEVHRDLAGRVRYTVARRAGAATTPRQVTSA